MNKDDLNAMAIYWQWYLYLADFIFDFRMSESWVLDEGEGPEEMNPHFDAAVALFYQDKPKCCLFRYQMDHKITALPINL